MGIGIQKGNVTRDNKTHRESKSDHETGILSTSGDSHDKEKNVSRLVS